MAQTTMTRGIDDMIRDREVSHGTFQDTAGIAQAIKATLRLTKNWDALPAESKEALELLATDLSRILTGDANAAEHWNGAAALLRVRGMALGGSDSSAIRGRDRPAPYQPRQLGEPRVDADA